MANFSTIDLTSVNIMLKGEPGLRKSTVALSYPLPHYWFSTDRKMEALHLPAKLWKIDTSKIEFDNYSNWDKAKSKLEKMLFDCPFKTIMIDSVTSFGDCMTSQVKKNKKANKDTSGKMIGGIQTSGLEEFNAESNAFQELIALADEVREQHHINVIYIAHVLAAKKDNDANKLTHHSRIIVTGAEKIGAKLASRMSETYHFNIKPSLSLDEPGEYGLFTSHTGNDYARTSLPLERYITFSDKPFYPTFIEPAIKKSLEK